MNPHIGRWIKGMIVAFPFWLLFVGRDMFSGSLWGFLFSRSVSWTMSFLISVAILVVPYASGYMTEKIGDLWA